MVHKSSPTKLFCYVDESGQDTLGNLFVVSVILATVAQQEQAIVLCEELERISGKGKVKWHQARRNHRIDYVRQLLREPFFHDKFYFASYRNSKAYLPLTVQTIAKAVNAQPPGEYKVTVFIDGLQRAHKGKVGRLLRQAGVKTKKIRGVKKEENDALNRLADAVCGWVRAAIHGEETFQSLLNQAKDRGYVKELEA